MLKNLFVFAFIATLVFSCSSDDSDDGGSNCPDLIDQTAQGDFRGESFVSPGGTYLLAPGGNNGYTCTIYVENRTDGDCVFPIFGNDADPQDSIKFPIDDLSLQTYTFSDTGGDTINFNRVAVEDNVPVTTAELAVCGTVTITEHDADADTLTGTITAVGQDGSEINGTFILDLCVF